MAKEGFQGMGVEFHHAGDCIRARSFADAVAEFF